VQKQQSQQRVHWHEDGEPHEDGEDQGSATALPLVETEADLPDTSEDAPTTTFHEHITTSPDWERELLEAATELKSREALCEVMLQPGAMAASNGGAIPELHMGSFGWVMATDDEVLWECKGPVRGVPSQSFRSEGYGPLSLFLFLCRHAERCGLENELHLRTGLDNTGVIQRDQEHREREADFPFYHNQKDQQLDGNWPKWSRIKTASCPVGRTSEMGELVWDGFEPVSIHLRGLKVERHSR
jgi:hypothetical protein